MKAWYDDINGITASVQTLDGFNKLLNARRQAGYSKGEKLDEFIVLGLWRLDSCGNALKANEAGGSSTPKKAFASIGMEAPLVIRCPDFLEFLKENFPKDSNEASMPFSYEKALPDARLVCSECGKPWTIANCDDVIIRGSQEDINLSGFVGRRLGEFFDTLEGRHDAIRHPHLETPIRNDRHIDLSPNYPDATEEWEKEVVKNKCGWVTREELASFAGIPKQSPHTKEYTAAVKEAVMKYVVQPGDDTFVGVYRYYHKGCFRTLIDKTGKDEFLKVFQDAGIKADLVPIANGYCPCDSCPCWFNANTPFGVIKIGWRKRVINIDCSSIHSIDVASLFKSEDVTKWNTGIHAWGLEKASEYLKTIQEAALSVQKV